MEKLLFKKFAWLQPVTIKRLTLNSSFS